MDNFLSGGIAELEQARELVEKADRLKETLAESEKILRSNEKEIENKRRQLNEKIDNAIKTRRNELSKYHDEQVNKEKKEIKSIKKERRSAKNKAVDTRISGETGDLQEENKKLNQQVKKLFRDSHIPAFCNTAYYYALYDPKTVRDFVLLAITAVMAIGIIPNVICMLIETKALIKILIYMGVIVFFFLVYFLIYIITKKGEKGEVISKARGLRRKIGKNKAQIRRLAREIRTDEDESSYGLEGYDDNIKSASSTLQVKEDAMSQALEQFDNVTAVSIRNEMEQEALPQIEQMEADSKALRADYQNKQAEYEAAERAIKNSYAAYLGTKNTTSEKINEMIEILRDGQAQTIMQALDIVSSKE